MRRRDLIEKALKIVSNYSEYDVEIFFIIVKSAKEEEEKCSEKVNEFGDNILIKVLRLYEL